jgi:hypothetical protein
MIMAIVAGIGIVKAASEPDRARRTSWVTAVVLCLLAVFGRPGPVAAQDEMQILSYPIGVVVGKIQIAVDLGSSARFAELFLDGKKVCDLAGRPATCTVNLGPDPHLHLLEAVRRSEDGSVVQRAHRWLNRPGEEVELDVLADHSADGKTCTVVIHWAHPRKLKPDSMTVTLDGWPLVATGPGYTYRFDCPANVRSAILTAYATFPDDRSAYAATTLGGFTGSAETPMSSVALTTANATTESCSNASLWPPGAVPVDDDGFEVAFVLDPAVHYNTLERSGRIGLGREPKPAPARSTWKGKSPSEWLQTARQLWYITPDSRLRRVDGFAEGRSSWLDVLFHVGRTQLKDAQRIADAVAVAGKQVADGPHRRAVVLLLGDRSRKRDDGSFTPRQARAYLGELGVPLVVFRNGDVRDDGWGEGLPAQTTFELINGLSTLRRLVASQCVFWFEGDRKPMEIAASLKQPVVLAGSVPLSAIPRLSPATDEPEVRTAASSVKPPEPAAAEPQEEGKAQPTGTAGTPQFAGRLNVTSVTVLVSAQDARGRPVSSLTASDLQVTEDGEPVEILGLRPVLAVASPSPEPESPTTEAAAPQTEATPAPEATASEPLPVTIFIDPSLSGRTAVRQATTAIESQIDRLVTLGPVEVVFGSDPAQTRLAATRDPARLRKGLNELAKKVNGPSEVERIRSQFIRDTKRTRHVTMKHDSLGSNQSANPEIPGTSLRDEETSVGMPGTRPGNRFRMAVRSAVGQEEVVVRHALRRIGAWALGRPGAGPRLLLVVGAAFDEQPEAFYLPFLQQKEPPSVPLMRAELEEHDHGAEVRQLGDELASAGWRVLALGSTTSSIGLAGSDSAEMAGDDRVTMMSTHGDAGTVSTPGRLQIDPIAAQTHLAEPSGGEAVVGVQGLATALASARGWYRLTYQVARPADGRIHALDVRSISPGVTIRSTSRIASTTTEGQAEARLAQLLAGGGRPGELPLRLRVEPVPNSDKTTSSANLELTADLLPLKSLVGDHPVRLRVSVLVDLAKARSIGVHRMVDLPALPGDGRFTYTVPMQWPTGEGRIAVSVEEITTGTFGATVTRLTP